MAASAAAPKPAAVVAQDYAANAARWQSAEFPTVNVECRRAKSQNLPGFTEAAEPFRGLSIKVVSEALTTHAYESEVLAKAFYEITGIEVVHGPDSGRRCNRAPAKRR